MSTSCLFHIRDLRRIRNTIDHTTACTIATSLVHSKLDYCNSLLLNLPSAQTKVTHNFTSHIARAVTKTPKFHHITPILKSLHWLNINERIQYKVLSLTYKTLNSSRPAYLHSLVTVNHSRSTRSSSLVTLNRPSNPSHLQLTKRSFYHEAPAMWNRLPPEFRQLAPLSSTSPLAISPTLFHKKLKTHLFHSSFPP